MAHRSPRLSNPQRNFIFDLGGMIAQSTKATFQSSKELYLQDKGADTVVFHQPFPILKGTLSSKEAWTPRERQVPFQSSKELYLPDDVTEMAITEQLFPILKGTLSSWPTWEDAMSHCDFPILKGTLSSTSRLRATGGRNSFQSSKELYLPAARGRDREGKLLSNPQRNFIFGEKTRGPLGPFFFPILKGTLSSRYRL